MSRFRATTKVMESLRERNRLFGNGNLRINEWVDEYLDSCVIEGKEVTFLTQWCVSKELEVRYQSQGECFVATKQEQDLFGTTMPWLANLFHAQGFKLSWWLTFNRNCLESGRINADLEAEYKQLIMGMAEPLVKQGWLLVVDWEDDILEMRSCPNQEVLAAVDTFVTSAAFQLEMERHISWGAEAGLIQDEFARKQDVKHQIACEAEEGRVLEGEGLLGNFLLVPVERAERYDFFRILAPEFKRRIVAVLPTNPWRI